MTLDKILDGVIIGIPEAITTVIGAGGVLSMGDLTLESAKYMIYAQETQEKILGLTGTSVCFAIAGSFAVVTYLWENH